LTIRDAGFIIGIVRRSNDYGFSVFAQTVQQVVGTVWKLCCSGDPPLWFVLWRLRRQKEEGALCEEREKAARVPAIFKH
jgi:hypothetical protein